MKHQSIQHETWLDLSDAAAYLGVHFTTLRRWVDEGKVACYRTPGGRRRFSVQVLDAFIQEMKQEPNKEASAIEPVEALAINHTRHNVQNLPATENWLTRMSLDQREQMKGTGHRLMALLLQFTNHQGGAEAFLEEGKRIIGEYGRVCSLNGFSLKETVHVFLFFRRSILDSIQETGMIGGAPDKDGRRLFQRASDFMDALLLDLIENFLAAPNSHY